MAQGGDFLRRDGACGESIYGGKFPNESPKLKHDGPGLLSMAIADCNTRGSLFKITFKAKHHLDRKYVVFGKLVQGQEVLKKIETAGDEDGIPAITVKIIYCGQILEDMNQSTAVLESDKMKVNKLKMGKDVPTEANNLELRHNRGNYKKSLKEKRKKRRRHYTSESDSSSDTETESSESDTDSDSDISSSTDLSSSSDDRRRKRKRSSKKEKQRRGKRRERHHEKKCKRSDNGVWRHVVLSTHKKKYWCYLVLCPNGVYSLHSIRCFVYFYPCFVSFIFMIFTRKTIL